MPRVAIAVAILALYVYGLVDVIRTDGRLTRGFSKTTWIIMVALLPLVGAALWFLIGRPRASAVVQPVYQQHPTAPDDDPDFLRNLEQRRRQAEAERRRKLRDDAARKNQADGGPHRAGSTGTGAPGTNSGNSDAGGPPAGEPGPRKPGAAGEANAEGNPEAK
ncbi:PLD nuclease N-terminal domain-containing protein [Arthrobacter sp. ISL-65]|uniref:PLD nuclease N-terminal domain-containing protein n=1 Tax=Arthrobacter sp. ISL-65 TaxID=2819112 RepID=UPI001BEB7F67|nr:PLD nuclease N-terminal domain-containing protein [Arthrobacter sp. ISL-65]MBT2549495.1 PLDc_N domain-containing protein [Arthrobacter sp. ISL-65]